jgi:hypothetical protein
LDRLIISRSGKSNVQVEINIYDDLSANLSKQLGKVALSRNDSCANVTFNTGFNNGLFVIVSGSDKIGTTIVFD